MRILSVSLLCVSALALQGCLAKTVLDAATLPVRAAGKAVDVATTSQSEADEKRGRELRKSEEELGRLERKYTKQREECREGDQQACFEARETYAEIQIAKRSVPAPPPER